MHTEQEQQIIGEELLQMKQRAIMVSLHSFTENYRKETTDELNKIWLDGLKTLSCEHIFASQVNQEYLT